MQERAVIPGAKGRTVAVVGRAGSLLGAGQGPAIDACDLVVRVNWLLPVSGPPEHVGSRTDIVYAAASGRDIHAAAKKAGASVVVVNRSLRKRLRSGRLRPTTGVVACYDALRSGAAQVRAFGFDFYRTGYAERSGHASGRRVLSGTLKWRHDPALDRRLMLALLADPRFHPDAVLREALA